MFKTTPLAAAVSLAIAAWPLATRAQSAPAVPAPSEAAASAPASAALSAISVEATADRLDAARNSLSPDTGASTYRFTRADIAKLPLGDATPMSQVLARAPGVVQDSSAAGQLHVRGDHGNLQYRINGVIVPESVSGFAQALDTRFAESVSLITGALPAQYGYRTAGVVDIRTRGAAKGNGGNLDVTVGSHGQRLVGGNVQGSSGPFSYFVSGSFLTSNQGLENPTASRSATHDDTRQSKGFAYLSYLLDADSRVSVMLGNSMSRFQIPTVPGQSPLYTLAGSAPIDSLAIQSNQAERNDFQVLSYQSKLSPTVDYQVSVFRRQSSVHYMPDVAGDLTYTGVASNVVRANTATGLQLDGSSRLGDSHIVRAGLFVQHEKGRTDNTSQVFAADADGNQTSTTPTTIVDNNRLGGNTIGAYVQDEWLLTDNLTLNYGARLDHVSTVVKESQFSPRIGAVYQLGENTRLHAGYARYFTPPATEIIDQTSVQSFLGTTNALPSDANTAVRSERSDYFDVGVSHKLTRAWTLGADAYYRSVRHLQDEGQFGSAYVYSAFNYDRGRIYGLELSATYENGGFSAYGNVALSSARAKGIESGQYNFDADELAYVQSNWVHLDHEQRTTASFGAAYRFDRQTTVTGDLLYGSGLRNGFANTTHLPSYWTVNGSVMHTFSPGTSSEMSLRLSVLNLFDRSYALRDGSGIAVSAPQYGARRALYLTLSKPFTF